MAKRKVKCGWPFRVEVKPRAPLTGYAKWQNDWTIPCPAKEAVGEYLFALYGDAFDAGQMGSHFWACIRVFDAEHNKTVAEWFDGKRVDKA